MLAPPINGVCNNASPIKSTHSTNLTIVVYVDDIVVKTAQACDLIANLAATFVNLQRFNIRLNPEKCVFGVPKGKLL